jgi:hypothetical protein
VIDEGLERAASRRVRRAVHVFLLLVALCGLAHREVWPLTGFRLFSEVRTRQREGWALSTVDSHGVEHVLHLSELPVGYRNTTKLIPGMADRSGAERDAICRAWADPLRARGDDVDYVRVYAVVEDAFPHGRPTVRTLTYGRCGRRG